MTDDSGKNELWQLGAKATAEKIKTREISAVEVIRSALDRLNQVNPAINAVVEEMPDEALATAAAIDKKIAKGEHVGPMVGVPVTIKINVDQTGYTNTNGLKIQKDNITDQDNPVVRNLKEAGAICIGRTNTPAFSMRWFTRNTLHGHTRNPVDKELTPGGSSGGAASAVASGIGCIAHGSDIAGSIRYPAYACGIHGIRPSLGRVPSLNPCAADRHIGAQITAVQGPLARSIDDLELALHAMAARDIRDPWWTPVPLTFNNDFKKTVALCVKPDGMQTEPVIEQALRSSAKKLADAGWTVDEVDCPAIRQPAEMQILLWMSEARRSGKALIEQENDPDASFVYQQMERLYPAPDLDGFLDLLQARAALTRQWMQFMDNYSIVLIPVSATLPFKDNLDVESPQAFEQVLEAQLTQIGLPFMGVPSIAVNTGSANGIPIGVQMVASRYREDMLLSAARDIEEPIEPVTPSFGITA